MDEIEVFEQFHPRAVKLLRKQKPFIVIAQDEPYYLHAYALIRANESRKGHWSEEDERIFKAAQHTLHADGLWACLECGHFNPPVRANCHSCEAARR